MSANGRQLLAATTVDGRDRQQFERLCPAFAYDAVKAPSDDRANVHFKAPWHHGLTHAVRRERS